MPLEVQKRSWKNKDGSETVTWRLIVVTYSGNDKECSYPAREDYHTYGLNPLDAFDVAKEKARVINRSADFKRRAALKAKIEKRVRDEKEKESAFLPRQLYHDYVEFLKGRRGWDVLPPKVDSQLLCMRRLILEIDVPPETWPMQAGKIFAWFAKKGLSMSYVKKVLPFLNDYGYYYCQHFKKPFIAVKPPAALHVERINDANAEARGGATKESLPLRVEQLPLLADMKPEQYLWIRYSLFFGLRPDEVDGLTRDNERTFPKQRGKRWEITSDHKGTPILVVYQPKLVKIPYEKRWKRIPCILPEQVELLGEVRKGTPIKRPYPKYVRARLGEGYTNYMGRKGFKPLMRAFGQSEFNIHRWEGRRDFRDFDENGQEKGASAHKAISLALGHSSLNRTNADYEDPTAVDYSPISKTHSVQ